MHSYVRTKNNANMKTYKHTSTHTPSVKEKRENLKTKRRGEMGSCVAWLARTHIGISHLELQDLCATLRTTMGIHVEAQINVEELWRVGRDRGVTHR